VLDERKGQNFTLHSKYVNPQLPRVLGILEFDRFYVRGEGCHLIDDEGDGYLDFLSGLGVFALGRGHPAIVQALHAALDADLPNLVQMDCSLLPGGSWPSSSSPGRTRESSGLLHQLRRGGGGERDQVRPCRHQADPHPLLQPRLPRPDYPRRPTERTLSPAPRRGQIVELSIRSAARD
jgi:Aminotransferase class-III